MKLKKGDALLIVDVINDLAFDGGEKILPWGEKLAQSLSTLRQRLKQSDVPTIYVNDNFGNWRAELRDIYAYCVRPGSRGRGICRKLKPGPADYFVLKPMHSAFYSTSLVPLLNHLGVKRLILCGIATNLCVLFTAHDAHMRGYKLIVLSDCCAAETDFDHNIALGQLTEFCDAHICRSTELRT